MDTRRRLERAMGQQFTVGDLVGRGGFAEVFAVHDLRLKRDLAVKVLSPELVVNQAMLTRFRREAEAIAALRHPGIVPIYDIGEAGGIAYIVMPLIKGDTLRKRLEIEGRLSVSETRRILVAVCDALALAHEAGLVHRDIKPENVMLEGPRNQVLVMDFGIAKAIDPDATGVTTSGLIVGTPHYMSPEQASGEPVDARSDQYSLAVLGYRMATGSHPFEAETTRALLYKQVFETAPTASERMPDVPASLSHALARGMSKECTERFPTIEAFGEAVGLESDDAVAAPPAKLDHTVLTPAVAAPPRTRTPGAKPAKPAAKPAKPAPPRRARPRWVAPLGASVGGVLLVGIITIAALSSRGGAPAPAQTAPETPGTAPADSAGAGLASADSAAAVSSAVSEPATARSQPDRAANPPPAPQPAQRPPPRPAANAPTSCAEAVRRSVWTAAASLCLAEADQGDPEAQLALAGMLERGEGVAQDLRAAAGWYERANQAGSGEAAWYLGRMIAEGRGVDANLARASELYLQAARRGVVPAMRATAFAYETGSGLSRNEREMVNWYRRAAAAGDAPSQVRLGDLYFEGRGVSRNMAEGARWYTRAAEAGHPAGEYALGMAYLIGRGVGRSDSLGMLWLSRAAGKGHTLAAEELARRQP